MIVADLLVTGSAVNPFAPADFLTQPQRRPNPGLGVVFHQPVFQADPGKLPFAAIDAKLARQIGLAEDVDAQTVAAIWERYRARAEANRAAQAFFAELFGSDARLSENTTSSEVSSP